MQAFVICNNDAIHHVVFGRGDFATDDTYAEKVKQKLKDEFEKKIIAQFGDTEDAKMHISASFWHIHRVSAEEVLYEAGNDSERHECSDNRGGDGHEEAAGCDGADEMQL